MTNCKCYICNTDMEKKKTSIEAGWGKYKLNIMGVSGYVCPKCGEATYSPEEALMIEKLGQELSQQVEAPNQINISEVEDLFINNQIIYNKIHDGILKARKIGDEWVFLRKDILTLIDDSLQIAARNNSAGISLHDTTVLEDELKDM